MVHFPSENTNREAERLEVDLGLLRAKKVVVVQARLEGRLDYDRAKEIEATLDEAIAYTTGRIATQ